jgi:hypothetical protein
VLLDLFYRSKTKATVASFEFCAIFPQVDELNPVKWRLKLDKKEVIMETITYSHVQKLVKRLPAKKLPMAYNLLTDLVKEETELQPPQFDFLLLPSDERYRMLAEQAKQMIEHYEQSEDERQNWQAGDFADGY